MDNKKPNNPPTPEQMASVMKAATERTRALIKDLLEEAKRLGVDEERYTLGVLAECAAVSFAGTILNQGKEKAEAKLTQWVQAIVVMAKAQADNFNQQVRQN